MSIFYSFFNDFRPKMDEIETHLWILAKITCVHPCNEVKMIYRYRRETKEDKEEGGGRGGGTATAAMCQHYEASA